MVVAGCAAVDAFMFEIRDFDDWPRPIRSLYAYIYKSMRSRSEIKTFIIEASGKV